MFFGLPETVKNTVSSDRELKGTVDKWNKTQKIYSKVQTAHKPCQGSLKDKERQDAGNLRKTSMTFFFRILENTWVGGERFPEAAAGAWGTWQGQETGFSLLSKRTEIHFPQRMGYWAARNASISQITLRGTPNREELCRKDGNRTKGATCVTRPFISSNGCDTKSHLLRSKGLMARWHRTSSWQSCGITLDRTCLVCPATGHAEKVFLKKALSYGSVLSCTCLQQTEPPVHPPFERNEYLCMTRGPTTNSHLCHCHWFISTGQIARSQLLLCLPPLKLSTGFVFDPTKD